MLKIDSKKRLFAVKSLRRVKNFEFFVDFSFRLESTSSTLFICDDDEDFIIIIKRLWDSENASSNMISHESHLSIFERVFEKRDENITEISTLQKRSRSLSDSSTSRVSDVQSKRFQRLNSNFANADSDTSTQSDHNYIFNAFWNSKRSKTSIIRFLSLKVSISTLSLSQTSWNSDSEIAERSQRNHLTETVKENFFRLKSSDSIQKMCEIA